MVEERTSPDETTEHEPAHEPPEHEGAEHHIPGDAPKGNFLAKHRVEIIAAAVGVAVTVYLYIRNKSASTTAATTTPATTTGTTTDDGGTTGTTGATGATGATGDTGPMGVSPQPTSLPMLARELLALPIIQRTLKVSSGNVTGTKHSKASVATAPNVRAMVTANKAAVASGSDTHAQLVAKERATQLAAQKAAQAKKKT